MSRAGLALVATLAAWAAGAQAQDAGDVGAHALARVNEARAAQRLPPLAPDARTLAAAQAHARDMAERRFYAHVSPEGSNHQDRYLAAGGVRWRLVAENIARCQNCGPPTPQLVDKLHDGWMNSPDHRENVLMRGLDGFGFGIATRGSDLYAVQVFAGPGVPRGLAVDEAADAAPTERQASIATAQLNAARRDAGRWEVALSPDLSEAGRTALPDPRSAQFDIERPLEIGKSLLPVLQRGWRTIRLVAGSCGGCGAVPTATDIRNFIDQWLSDPALRDVLTGPEPSHLGFAMTTDGAGRKIAVAVLATLR